MSNIVSAPLQAAILPANAGWNWIVQGYTLFKRQPAAMLFWSMFTSMLVNIGILIPLLGQVILLVLTPALSFITISASRHLSDKQRLMPYMWLAPLKQNGVFARLHRLGWLYFACSFVIALLAITPFLSELLTSMDGAGDIDMLALTQAMQAPLILFGILYVLLSALFWHTPALVAWHNLAIKRALFYSMVACWRNKYAIIVFIACWAGVYFGIHELLGLLLATGVGDSLVLWLALALDILITALIYSSFYPIYATIFQSDKAFST